MTLLLRARGELSRSHQLLLEAVRPEWPGRIHYRYHHLAIGQQYCQYYFVRHRMLRNYASQEMTWVSVLFVAVHVFMYRRAGCAYGFRFWRRACSGHSRGCDAALPSEKVWRIFLVLMGMESPDNRREADDSYRAQRAGRSLRTAGLVAPNQQRGGKWINFQILYQSRFGWSDRFGSLASSLFLATHLALLSPQLSWRV